MHNAMWTAVTGSVFQMRRLDVIANNIANVNTVGFRGDRMDFSSYLAQIRQREFTPYRRQLNDISELIHTRTNFQPGMIVSTGNPLDLAMVGRGFFVVDGPNGPLYTRAGNFQIDETGQLTTADGLTVQGENGPIRLREGLPFEITPEGAVFQEDTEVGRLRLVEIENPETMVKIGRGRFRSTQVTRVSEAEQREIMPNSLEGSNINLIREMTNLIQAGRAFESYQKIISMINNVNQQANSKLAQIGG